jgi:hypothetical protein
MVADSGKGDIRGRGSVLALPELRMVVQAGFAQIREPAPFLGPPRLFGHLADTQ